MARKLAAWLAEERGDMGLSLSEEWASPLSTLHDNGKWTERHVLKAGMVVSQAHATMWRGILDAAAALYAAEGSGTFGELDIATALAWALTPSDLFAVTPSLPPGVDLAPDDGMDVPRTDRSAPAVRAPAAPRAKPLPPQAMPIQQAVEDMAKQGASRVRQLIWLSLTIELGRSAVDKEMEGGEYGASLSICLGLVKANKVRGFKPLSELLAIAKLDGDMTMSDRHADRLQVRLMQDNSEPFSLQSGARFTQFWSRSKTVHRDPRVVACYALLMLDEYMSRGLPELYNHELMRQAERSMEITDAQVAPPLRVNMPRSHTTGDSTASSSVGSGLSTANTERLEQLMTSMASQLTSVSDGQIALSDKVDKSEQRMQQKINDVSSRIGRSGSGQNYEERPEGLRMSGGRGDRNVECIACGKKGHRMADCSQWKSFQSDKKKKNPNKEEDGEDDG